MNDTMIPGPMTSKHFLFTRWFYQQILSLIASVSLPTLWPSSLLLFSNVGIDSRRRPILVQGRLKSSDTLLTVASCFPLGTWMQWSIILCPQTRSYRTHVVEELHCRGSRHRRAAWSRRPAALAREWQSGCCFSQTKLPAPFV